MVVSGSDEEEDYENDADSDPEQVVEEVPVSIADKTKPGKRKSVVSSGSTAKKKPKKAAVRGDNDEDSDSTRSGASIGFASSLVEDSKCMSTSTVVLNFMSHTHSFVCVYSKGSFVQEGGSKRTRDENPS